MRWNSVIKSTSEGDRSAEITIHVTEGEAALITLALEEFKINAQQGLIEHRPDLEFGPAQYVAVEFLVDWLERACFMTREQLFKVKWWETLEELDVEDWAEFAPRCDLAVNGDEMPSCRWQRASEMTLRADLITACK